MKENITVLCNYEINGKLYNFFAWGEKDNHYLWIACYDYVGNIARFVTTQRFNSLDEAISFIKNEDLKAFAKEE